MQMFVNIAMIGDESSTLIRASWSPNPPSARRADALHRDALMALCQRCTPKAFLGP